MNRRSLLILFAVSALAVAGCLVLPCLSRMASPRLRLLGFTNSPSATATLAVLCLENSARHTIYMSGPTNGSTFFSREVAASGGWQPAEVSAPPTEAYTWRLSPGRTFVFSVPVITNQKMPWRVAVRYFRWPWAGSGKYNTISTVISKPQPSSQRPTT